MFQVSFTLPTTRHDGYDNSVAIQAIEKEIAKSYKGFTSLTCSGGWFDEVSGRYYAGTSKLVYTFVEHESDVEALLDRSKTWALWLEQIELLVMVSTISTYFVKGTRKQAVA